MNTITFIATTNIVPNAGYSRSVMDQDLIEFIRNSIRQNNGLKPENALKVRQIPNNIFEIIDGHIRFEAAKQENLEELPCIVVEMDDDEAYMALINENKCQEMTALDIGLHALGFESRVGGRGNKSDLTLYAEKIRKHPQNVRLYRDGAKVYKHIETELFYDEKMKLRSKATVLCDFKNLNDRSWLGLSKIVVNRKYGTPDLKKGIRLVKKVMEMENSEEWIDAFLPYEKIIALSMAKATSFHLIDPVFKELNRLKQFYENNPEAGNVNELHDWLSEHGVETDQYGRERLKFRDIVKHCKSIMNGNNKEMASWIEGDCLEHIHEIPDNSVALLLTDPPYGCTYRSISDRTNRTIANDNPEDSTRILKESLEQIYPKMKDDSYIVVFSGDKMLADFINIIKGAGFTYQGVAVWKKSHHTQGSLISGLRPITEKIIYATKGKPVLYDGICDHFEYPNTKNQFHQTEKPAGLLRELIGAMTVPGDSVVDCFAGSGSTVVQAKAMGRNWWGCVLDPDDYQNGYMRLNEDMAEAA